MKKNVQLDKKGFLLVETLLVSLTIASILLYMYVQYSEITDSYKRLNRYNSVENLYRTEKIKQIILVNATDGFFNELDSKGVLKDPAIINMNELKSDLEVQEIYVTSPEKSFFESITDDNFQAFLNTIPEDEKDKYQIIVNYRSNNSKDTIGTFAIVSFERPNS